MLIQALDKHFQDDFGEIAIICIPHEMLDKSQYKTTNGEQAEEENNLLYTYQPIITKFINGGMRNETN